MTRSKNTSPRGCKDAKTAPTLVDCTDCHWAQLFRYDAPGDPVLAECMKKPQPYAPRHPYAVEVARARKICPMHLHTDVVKTIQVRIKVRTHPKACYALSENLQTA